MSRKVLISFLGKGAFENKEKRKYRKIKYKYNGTEKDTSFVADFLKDIINPDLIIFIGTVKSIWEELYASFLEANEDKLLEDSLYVDLYEFVDKVNYKTDLTDCKVLFERLEQQLKNVKIILIKYGLSPNEFKYNAETILGKFDQILQTGDEIHLDITHSFRSLPLILSQVLFYYQDINKKRVEIKKVYYGMLEAISELNYAPIVDLSYLLHLNMLQKGAYSFKEFGNAYLLADLIQQDDLSKLLTNFSDTKNLNLLFELKNLVGKIKKIDLNQFEGIERIIISETLKEFTDYFKKANKHHEFQFSLAKWHFSKKNYSSAILVFIEAIITYVCEVKNLDWKEKEHRERAKEKIMKKQEWKDLKKIYNKINSYRKKIAHSQNAAADVDYIISEVDNNIKKFEKFLSNKK